MLRSSLRTSPLFLIPRPPRQRKPGPNSCQIGPSLQWPDVICPYGRLRCESSESQQPQVHVGPSDSRGGLRGQPHLASAGAPHSEAEPSQPICDRLAVALLPVGLHHHSKSCTLKSIGVASGKPSMEAYTTGFRGNSGAMLCTSEECSAPAGPCTQPHCLILS